MNLLPKSISTAGVAVIGAGVVAVAPSIEPPEPSPAVQLTAATSASALLDPPELANPLLNWAAGQLFDWASETILNPLSPPSLGVDPPTLPTLVPPDTSGPLGATIKNQYVSYEVFAEYGVDFVAWALGWVPPAVATAVLAPAAPVIVGCHELCGLGYELIEPVVASVVFNVAEIIDGEDSLIKGLNDFARDALSQIVLVVRELVRNNSALPLLGAANAEAEAEETVAVAQQAEPIVLPEDKSSGPASPVAAQTKEPVETESDDAEKVAVKTAASGAAKVAPDEDVTEELESLVDEAEQAAPRARRGFAGRGAQVTKSLVAGVDTLKQATVKAQGEVRSGLTEAVQDVKEAAASGERGAVRDAVRAAPSKVRDGLRDGARELRSGVDTAVSDVRSAVKGGDSDSGE